MTAHNRQVAILLAVTDRPYSYKPRVSIYE